MQPFTVHVPDEVLSDLRERIARTRWPDEIADVAWSQGTPLSFLQDKLLAWSAFDWPSACHALNAVPQFVASFGDVTVHFVHQKAKHGSGIPLILTHGWPSAYIEYLPVMRMLTDPASFGIDGPEFDVVIPSLPGYGFSPRPLRTGVNYRYVADVWRSLMRSLGYARYGAGGGDFGSGVAAFMALDDPASVIGLHLTNFDLTPPLSTADTLYQAEHGAWASAERGYSAIQSTKPQTLGYGLNDSPAGLAAWLLEKWRSWCGTPPPDDFLLTLLTLYWVTGSITPSLRDYYDNRWHAVTPSYIDVPTAAAVFPNQQVFEGEPTRDWLCGLYDIQRWTVYGEGGHFAPIEQPHIVAHDIAAFFASL
ncbi:epoxide hydrolase family protein [Catelliglobosispora koreensis]|uniref:epoxide hydrolase family protein n=1 Tax=Catelliglobosispora koreensis TaxID=129052 RepID=UPI001FDEB75B|nr:epoxide hydrolase family protein [Catelliglobosispora koreensis]